MTVLSQSSLHIRWRDMARSNESVRQLVNNDDLRKAIGDDAKWDAMKKAYDDPLKIQSQRTYGCKAKQERASSSNGTPKDDFDLPIEGSTRSEFYLFY
jgi:hypothetical protein